MESLGSLRVFIGSHSPEFTALALAAAFAALVLSLIAFLRLRTLLRPIEEICKEQSEADYLPALARSTQSNTAAVDKLAGDIAALREEGKKYFKHFGLVRYDAFEDIGGKQSYSLCMLDSKGNGYIITYLTGRNFTRSYAVRINNGEHSRKLSGEELQAFNEASSLRS